jgi:hypothetical protein
VEFTLPDGKAQTESLAKDQAQYSAQFIGRGVAHEAKNTALVIPHEGQNSAQKMTCPALRTLHLADG